MREDIQEINIGDNLGRRLGIERRHFSDSVLEEERRIDPRNGIERRYESNRRSGTDRRDNARFYAQEGAFAIHRNHIIKMGQILNVSINGLAFSYIDDGKWQNGSFNLDIFLTDRGFYLKSVQSKIISDCEILNEIPFSSIIMRRRGVQFEELMDNQGAQLEYFLQNHTIKEG